MHACYVPVQKENVHLQGQLAENHRMEDVNRNELEAARLKTIAAVNEKARAEEQCLEACRQMDSLQDMASKLETAEDKLQASQRYAEELEQKVLKAAAERDEYQRKSIDANEWIMQHLHTQV